MRSVKATSRVAAAVALVALVVGLGAAGIKSFWSDSDELYGIDNWPARDWRLFSDDSVWNAPLEKSNVAPNSATMIRKMLADGPPAPSTSSSREAWGFPVYFGRPSDPLYRLELSETSHPFEQEIDGARIHVPADAKPSAGSDRVLRVVDQPSGFVYHIQQAKIDEASRTIVAWRSHRLRVDGLGFRDPTSPPTGIGPIRPEELAAGEVNHTIMLSVRCLSGHPVPPYAESVTRGDSCRDSDASTTRLSIGNVVFVDLSDAEIDALPVSTWEKALLRGLADHGALVAFNGDAAWGFQFEGPQSRTAFGERDPYASAGLPETLDYSETLDSAGGWGAHLKVLAAFRRPCGDVLCDRPRP